MLVSILSDIKSAVILSVFLSGDRYLGNGATNRREMLHDGRAMARAGVSSPILVAICLVVLNAGSKKGFG